MGSSVTIRSPRLDGVEVGWFAPICNGDFEFMGVMDDSLKSTYAHARDVALRADALGFRNLLCPSSYVVGQDTLSFAAAIAPQTKQINLLTAIRCGEVHPPMLARAIATLDHVLEGRLTLNIISSDLPGETLESSRRYARSREVVQILKQAWTQDAISFHGEFYDFELETDPVRPYQQNGGPLLYFGGYSPDAKALCAEHCDVYLMWPETRDRLHAHMQDVSALAAAHGRTIDFGLRVHVIVRETESDARAYARRLMSMLAEDQGVELRERAQDAHSLGVSKQADMRAIADDEGYAEELLWTGIGRARSGCGAALVGTPDQIVAKLEGYTRMGIRAFILSGYPQKDECEQFGRHVLPRLKTVSLPEAQERIPTCAPMTPLAAAPRR